MLGSESCTLDLFISIVAITRLIYDTLELYVHEHEESDPSALDKLRENLELLFDLRDYRSRLRSSSGEEDPHSYRTLVKRCRRRVCEDPRDHIFGLAGIGRHSGMRTVEVDYTKSTREVYLGFMRDEVLRHPDSLMVFGNCSAERVDLPSWVPDFSKIEATTRFSLSTYSAGGRQLALKLSVDSFSPEHGTLALPGYRLDTIRDRSDPYEDMYPAKKWCLTVEKNVLKDDSHSSPYGNYEGRYDAYWRTLSGNKYGIHVEREIRWRHRSIPQNANGDVYELLLERVTPVPIYINRVGNEAIMEDTLGFKAEMTRIMHHRRLLLTRNGYCCVGPRDTNPEDLVVVITGLRMPLILRERSNGTTYELIGPAYVHGIMEGEFVEETQKSENEQPEIFYVD